MSIFKPATVVYYSNSGVSVVFYLLCVGLLGWKMYRKTERRYFPFIILMFLLETVNIVAKNVYQKVRKHLTWSFNANSKKNMVTSAVFSLDYRLSTGMKWIVAGGFVVGIKTMKYQLKFS